MPRRRAAGVAPTGTIGLPLTDEPIEGVAYLMASYAGTEVRALEICVACGDGCPSLKRCGHCKERLYCASLPWRPM